MGTVIAVEGLWKQYRFGSISHHTLYKDLQSLWARARGKEDPNLPIKGHCRTAPGAGDEKFWALRDVSFGVKSGEVLGIIGRNGAGKSTLLKIMSRITTPTRGTIKVKGRIASLLEVGTGFHPELTGRENVFLNGAILGMRKAEIARKFDEIVDFAEIERFIDTPVKRYSSGMYVRLAFAVAAHLEPEILVVDEVLAVGDAAFQQKCIGKMSDVAHHGRTVIFVSHNMAAISQLTERCLVLKAGSLEYDGLSADSIRHYTVTGECLPTSGRQPLDQLQIRGQWVENNSVMIVEIGLFSGADYEIPSGGTIRIEMLIENQAPRQNVRFGYTVSDEFDVPVLTGFTSPISLPGKGKYLSVVSLGNLPLSPGNYNISASIGHGGLLETKSEYHAIFGFGSFRVLPVFSDGTRFAGWKKAWGGIVHRDSSVQVSLL